MLRLSNEWKDYECLDAGNGEKLESWNGIILRRPDPQAMWDVKDYSTWKNVDGFYHRSEKGGGNWDFKKKLPDYWEIKYKHLTFKVTPTNFKHTGLFPEQATNWDFMMDKIKNAGRPIKVLNLFSYTGAATMACSSAGAEVVQVDASKGMTEWAKENMHLCGLDNNKIRFIVDDCLKFVEREYRRGNKYDGIVMDPPSYGRGPNGEVWKFEKNLYVLIEACLKILSDEPIFFLINSYTTGISSIVLENILKTTILPMYPKGTVDAGEVGLPIKRDNMILPCGIYGRWQSMINIIYEDNHLLVVEKPINILVQEDNTGDIDLLTILKGDIKKRYNKPGNVYLGLVHRLDRPVGGVMVFAKTSKCASRLSEQIRTNKFDKVYHAVVCGKTKNEDTLKDKLLKDEKTNTVIVDSKGKDSSLRYELRAYKENLSLVKIYLETGRTHQIRVQFSSRGYPLYGDQRYNKSVKNGEQIALFASSLSFYHPITKEKLYFELPLPNTYPWNIFK